MSAHQFQLPAFFDIGATFIWAITGAGLGVRKGYDVTGVFVMAFVSALGGGLLRDGIFLQHGPPEAVRQPAYLLTVSSARSPEAGSPYEPADERHRRVLRR